jgi:HK97 family phage major capsid protein
MPNLERDALLSEARTILSKQNFTKEDSSRAEGILNLADRLGEGAQRLRRAKTAAAELDLGIRSPDNAGAAEVETEFREYLGHGQKALLSENTRKQMGGAIRAEGQASGSIGGFIVPASFVDKLESSLVAGDRIFEVATLFQTRTGSAFNHPIVDDQDPSHAATIIAENSQSVSGPDIGFPAGVVWGVCPTWRSGLILASMELAQDSRFDLATVIAAASAARLAKGIGAAFVATLLSEAVVGVTAAATGAIAGDELFDLVSSVDDAYAQNGSWVMRLSTLQAIWKLKASGGGQYLFPQIRDGRGHPLLLGFPIFLSPSMPALGASAKTVTFGDHTRFYRRQVENSLQVKVFVERYATAAQTGYETYLRCDGHLLKAPDFGSPSVSQSPVKYLQMHS